VDPPFIRDMPWTDSPLFERELAASGLDATTQERLRTFARDGLLVFDPGLPEDDEDALEKKGTFAEVRKSEARFIPFHLKNTLESTGHWGAVRVVPAGGSMADVTVSGRILVSNGKTLAIDTEVTDSKGRVWRDRKYKAQANTAAYGDDKKSSTTLRIIADHCRSAAFLVHDGVLPSNEGRGYVLRKIIRRALRHARLAGSEKPFLYEMTGFVAELMKPGYPELIESAPRVARIVKEEEIRYQHSFAMAERMFESSVEKLEGGVIPGSVAFKLYDTFGLSLDEQEDAGQMN